MNMKWTILNWIGYLLFCGLIGTSTLSGQEVRLNTAKDCDGAVTVCRDTIFQFIGGVGKDDFLPENNSPGCLVNRERNAAWFYVEFNEDVPLNSSFEFAIQTVTRSIADLNISVYGPNLTCDSIGIPIRCSGFTAPGEPTGLSSGSTDFFEGVNFGDGWLAPINVQPGQGYFILLDYFNNFGFGDEIQMTVGGTAASYINCNALANCGGLQIMALDDINICKGGIVPLEVSISSLKSVDGFTWNAPTGHLDWMDDSTLLTPNITIPDGFIGTLRYELTVESGFCTKNKTINIQVSPELIAPIVGVDSFCRGTEATLSSQFEYDHYSWSTGDTTSSIEIIEPGNYSLTVTDDTGCIGDSIRNVNWFDPPEIVMPEDTVICKGTRVLLSGGTGFSTYQWSSGSTFPFLLTNIPKTYYLTVTDDNGCQDIDSIHIEALPLPEPELSSLPVICSGTTVSIGLTEAFNTYQWSNGATTPFTTINQEGAYGVTVSDNNGCQGEASFEFEEVPIPEVTISGNTLKCPGESVTLSSDQTFASYLWSSGGTDSSISVSQPGDYSLTVTNRAGCSNEATITVLDLNLSPITWPESAEICEGDTYLLDIPDGYLNIQWDNGSTDNPLIVSDPGEYTLTAESITGCTIERSIEIRLNKVAKPEIIGPNTICSNDSIQLSTSEIYDAYSWSNGTTDEHIWINEPGQYEVTVFNRSCAASDTILIEEAPFKELNIVGDSIICGADTILLVGEGGFQSYRWSNGASNPSISVSIPGTYFVEVEDDFACSYRDSIIVSQVEKPSVSISGDHTFCLGGSTELFATDGYVEYAWSTGGMNVSEIINIPGDHQVTITDLNGCQATASILLLQSPPEKPRILGDSLLCPMSVTQLSVADLYETYQWSNGNITPQINGIGLGTYTITVTDELGCTAINQVEVTEAILPTLFIEGPESLCEGSSTELKGPDAFEQFFWSNGAIDQSISLSEPGQIDLMAIDTNGCEQQTSIFIEQLPTPFFSIEGKEVLCPEDTLVLNGPDNMAIYDWSNGSQNQTIEINEPGVYELNVTAVNGCVAQDRVEILRSSIIPLEINSPGQICPGDSTSISINLDYHQYFWNNEEVLPGSITAFSTGTFSLSVSDSLGCRLDTLLEIGVFPVQQPTIQGDFEFCEGETATLWVPDDFVDYQWSNGINSNENEISLPGVYVVEATDLNNCITFDSVTVVENSLPVVEITGPTSFCRGDTIVLTSDAIFPVMEWSNGEEGTQILVDQPGPYQLTITDDNQCKQADTIEVIEKALPSPLVEQSKQICLGDTTRLEVPGYEQYQWFDGSTAYFVEVNQPGNYAVAITNVEGCSNRIVLSVLEKPTPYLQLIGDTTLCEGTSTSLSFFGAFENYQWEGQRINSPLSVNGAGIFEVDILGENGCLYSQSYQVRNIALPKVQLLDSTYLDCNLEGYWLSELVTHIDEPVSYFWEGPGIDASNAFSSNPFIDTSGKYTLTIMDTIHQCQSEPAEVYIADFTNPPKLEVNYSGTLDCRIENVVLDGSASAIGPDIVYQWKNENFFLTNQTIFNATEEGYYIFEVKDTFRNCASIDTFLVEGDFNLPNVEAGNTKAITCKDSIIQLDGSNSFSSRDVDYFWKTTNGSILSNPSFVRIDVNQPGTYFLEIFNEQNGCTGVDSVEVLDQTKLKNIVVPDTVTLNCYPLETPIDLGISEADLFKYAYHLNNDLDTLLLTETPLNVHLPETLQLELFNQQTGCFDSFTVVLLENPQTPKVVYVERTDPTCPEVPNGIINVGSIEGGSAPYLISLNNEAFSNQPLFDQLPSGDYPLIVEGADGCQSYQNIPLRYGYIPSLSINHPGSIQLGDSVTMVLESNMLDLPDIQLHWKVDGEYYCEGCEQLNVQPTANQLHEVTIVSKDGCSATTKSEIKVERPYEVWLPNAFSPNADGHNDLFRPYPRPDVAQIKSFRIFDRWGDLVFDRGSFDPYDESVGWDGTYSGVLKNAHVFVYQLEVVFIDGTEKVITGDVLLMN